MKHWSYITASLLILLMFSGCGGTKMLRVPQPLVFTEPLSSASDRHLFAQLDTVIIRDGPGTWAKNVDWDEYIISVRSAGGGPLLITGFTAVDSLGTRIESLNDRHQLVKGTKETKRRYKGEEIEVKAGLGTGAFLTAGAATLAGSAATVAAVSNASLAAQVYGVAAASGGVVLVIPAIAVGGIYRAVNNSKVNQQIEFRQIQLPFEMLEGQEENFHVFFPLTPSPRQVEIAYVNSRGEQKLIIDTNAVLKGLHLAQAKNDSLE